MGDYNFKEIESKWGKHWFDNNIYKAEDFSEKPKKYILTEFPYPSGKSMHMGHVMRYTVPEMYSRYLRMKGYNVLFPMGWDAFGLPTENYAIKTGVHPAIQTEKLAKYYRDSMQGMGYAIDWAREINTTDPKYFKWTQWIFLKFFEQGLAELKEEPVWWSEDMKSVLAEEEVEKDADGNLVAERDGSPVEKRMLKQWVLKIPAYADKLIEGLDSVDFPDSIKAAQTNWIGRSEGTVVKFPVKQMEDQYLDAFTTRVDTIFGVTFMVVAPEHEIVKDMLKICENPDEVQEYVSATAQKTELERQQDKVKTGQIIKGITVQNPFDESQEIPVFVADYVLRAYGTGIVMGVPAHDERDYEFAKKYGLEIIQVIAKEKGQIETIDDNYECFADYGFVVNSGEFTDMSSNEAKDTMTAWLDERDMGHKEVTYKIRDWLFSRQRYWGEPMPLVHKADGTVEAIADTNDPDSYNKNLPLELPEVDDFKPTADGSSPLTTNKEWITTTAADGTDAIRETNTMPNWAGSCCYYVRYLDPENDSAIADMDKMKYWLPVDKYFGGSEHTTLHLLYSRFWYKFLHDQGVVPTSEPYNWRMNGGTLLAPDGSKMSKSKDNGVEPSEKVELYGADSVRMYIAFIGPYDGAFPYSENSLKACHRVIETINTLRSNVADVKDVELEKKAHRLVKSVSQMAEAMKMNTIVSDIMVFTKELKDVDQIPVDVWKKFILILAPITPFIAEELWQEVNGYAEWKDTNSVHLQGWPEFDEALTIDSEIEVPVQINGKMRGTISIERGMSEEEIKEITFNDGNVTKYCAEDEVKKFIYIKEKIVNIVK